MQENSIDGKFPHPCPENPTVDRWSSNEEDLLTDVVKGFFGQPIDWKLVASRLPGRSVRECWAKFTDLTTTETKKLKWSDLEDKMLHKWVAKNGPAKWASCALMIPGRIGRQCRDRWMNVLDPGLKVGDWSDAEQLNMFELMKDHLVSWRKISNGLIGRTENSIKNYFYSTIRRIQNLTISDLFIQVRAGQLVASNLSVENLESEYHFDSINLLGKAICKWLYYKEEAKKENLALFEHLLKVITESKRRPTKINLKSEIPSNSESTGYTLKKKKFNSPIETNSQSIKTRDHHPQHILNRKDILHRSSDRHIKLVKCINPMEDGNSLLERNELLFANKVNGAKINGLSLSLGISNQLGTCLSINSSTNRYFCQNKIRITTIGSTKSGKCNDEETNDSRYGCESTEDKQSLKNFDNNYGACSNESDHLPLPNRDCKQGELDQGDSDHHYFKDMSVIDDMSNCYLHDDSSLYAEHGRLSPMLCCECMMTVRDCRC